LSVDDGVDQVSQSIENQRNILSKYVLDQGWNIYNVYVDDGFSGTNFERPGFKKMRNDIESGLIDIVITKDLSRLGRDYIETGRLTEQYFPDHGIRYIALSDNVDSAVGIDDFVPFKNIVNEFYAKDISKKIRTTQKFLMESGAFRRACMPIYGYMYNEEDKRIINPDTAPNVVEIFDLFTRGYSLKGICKHLEERKIKTPYAYNLELKGKSLDQGVNPYVWSTSTVSHILRNREYLGHYVRGKTSKRFKSKTVHAVPLEKQYVFENVFEPIVTQELFDFAQKMFINNKQNGAINNPFAGILYCGVCGKPMNICKHKSGSGFYEERYACREKDEIGKGSILVSDLKEVVKQELFSLKTAIFAHKEDFSIMADRYATRFDMKLPNNECQIKVARVKNRINKLHRYIKDLFEQQVDSDMDEGSYQTLLSEYKNELQMQEKELQKLAVVADLATEDEGKFRTSCNAFLDAVKAMDENNYLSTIIFHNVVSKIFVTTFKESDAQYGRKGKNITIFYRFCDDLIKDFIRENIEE
jgi:DNA invertase Pin-like site-specific DNA recombinase